MYLEKKEGNDKPVPNTSALVPAETCSNIPQQRKAGSNTMEHKQHSSGKFFIA